MMVTMFDVMTALYEAKRGLPPAVRVEEVLQYPYHHCGLVEIDLVFADGTKKRYQLSEHEYIQWRSKVLTLMYKQREVA